jgi:ABC-type transporter Mla MlaB component
MRVTIHEQEPKHVTLQVEGKIAGPHVPVLHGAWQELAPSIGQRRLRVDLRGVTHVDGTGRNLLAEIHAKTGAEFLADTPLTKYFAEQARQGSETISS